MIEVFIENVKGSDVKHHHDEKNLVPLFDEVVARPFPYDYGFVIGTTAAGGDGDNVDCFVITDRDLHPGDVVLCEPLALMEQVVDGYTDHNVVAVPLGAPPVLPADVAERLAEFIAAFREHQPEVDSRPGRLLGAEAALAFVAASLDPPRA